ncbi:acetoacetate decarboxylase [Nucisporomicrobium flavum]|uniref:acetoacetate decarboxylase n=1 Tax=Nucisporomicrobium flavum TaxID=2785915 RepID=UPI0018F37E22|nr:acetoacetate decarboxylase [Nucisporomicrobium flavum]
MHPPSPWNLRGRLYLSVFALPAAALPALPGGLRPLTVAGRVLLGAAWVRYEPGGTLHYRELLTAVLLRDLRVSIVDIWVDSEASRDGGRSLWAIPKDLATLEIDPPAASAAGIATAVIRPGRRWPGRWPAPMRLRQARGSALVETPVRGRTALRSARVAWAPERSGRLAYLAGRKPVLSLVLDDFRLRFGR